MALTDSAGTLQKWLFPAGVTLQPGEFLVVFASGKDRAVAGQELHTNFNLSASGEYLALVAADGVTPISEFAPGYPAQQSDISYGFTGLYLPEPTPGAANGSGVTGFVGDVSISVPRGFYSSSFLTQISTPTAGATLVFTTDSSTPSLSNGTQVDASVTNVHITGTTVVRAAAFKSGLAPTAVSTTTYLFLDDVVTQSDNPNDYDYPNWNNLDQNRTADYGMDAGIAGGLFTLEEVKASLASLPTISMATDAEKLFDREAGNYSNSKKGGQAWERDVSLEFFGFPHGETLQVGGGLRLAGNASRSPNRHKHNMRVAFRREYGAGTLEFPLFPGEDVTTFNSIQLRAGNGDSWVNPGVRDRATYLRDQWHRDAQIAMDQHSQSQMFAHLYINGMYWGVFHIFERIEDDFMVEHFGGGETDWDVRDHVSAFDGSDASWNATAAIADHPATMADAQNYADMQQYLDYVHLIDYLLIHFYSNSDDWDQNNFRAGFNRMAAGDTYEFFAWDQERTLLNTLSTGNVNGARAIDKDTNTSSKKGMTHFHQRLRANPEYRLLFADRVRKHCFHGGTLTPAGANALWDARAAEVRPSMIAESARWGDLHGAAKTPADWEGRVALEKTGWFDIRTPIFLQLLRDRDLYPPTDAPDYAIGGTPQHGGGAPANAQLSISAPAGTIYYTLDGNDPREAVTGNAVGTVYSAPVTLTQSVVAKARALDGGVWSALTEAAFLVGDPARAGDIAVSELMYHPAGDGLAEYVDLHIETTSPVERRLEREIRLGQGEVERDGHAPRSLRRHGRQRRPSTGDPAIGDVRRRAHRSLEPPADPWKMLAAEVELAPDDVAGHAEDARVEDRGLHGVVLDATLAFEELREAGGVGARVRKESLDHGRVLGIDLAAPERHREAQKVGPQHRRSLPLRPLEADVGSRGIPDLHRAAKRPTAQGRIAPRVSIGVLHGRPLLRRPVLLGDAPTVVELRRAQVARNVERERTPVDLDAELVRHLPGGLRGEEGVGALEVDVDDERGGGGPGVERRRHGGTLAHQTGVLRVLRVVGSWGRGVVGSWGRGVVLRGCTLVSLTSHPPTSVRPRDLGRAAGGPHDTTHSPSHQPPGNLSLRPSLER